jgi:hypothetical protein
MFFVEWSRNYTQFKNQRGCSLKMRDEVCGESERETKMKESATLQKKGIDVCFNSAHAWVSSLGAAKDGVGMSVCRIVPNNDGERNFFSPYIFHPCC